MTRAGLQMWNLNTIKKPELLGEINLETMKGGDYSGTPWWLGIQGRYVFVGGTNTGLHVVDMANPRKPLQILRMPVRKTGGFRIGPTYAVGNFLVISSMDSKGISTFDISDPAKPVLLGTSDHKVGYSSLFNGWKLFAVDTIPKCWDLSKPEEIKLISQFKGKKMGSKGEKGDGKTFVSQHDEVLWAGRTRISASV